MFSEVLETYDPAPVVDSTPAGDRRNAKRKEEQAGKLPMPWKQFTGVGGADGVHYFTRVCMLAVCTATATVCPGKDA